MPPFRPMARMAPLWFLALFALLGSILVGPSHPASAARTNGTPAAATPAADDVPVLAYYYIWFDPSSWNRAKTDYPLLGRYSSDDPAIMREHVRWAKAAGIDGFIVSWKDTDRLSPRLKRLVHIAHDEDFKLVIIYQGLDFERDPLPIDKIAADLDYFEATYGDDDVFDLFGKPAVIWSGTWEFSPEEIAAVTESRRDKLLILASEKQVDGYRRLADLVDGNAYYWSSVNPETQPTYGKKLQDMADAIHAHGGIWVAPAAPGFDARLIGGTRVVDRENGETLRTQLNTALSSSPDAVGIISWNEFSENSHVEPSCEHGEQYLVVIADALGGTAPNDIGACPVEMAASPIGTPVAAIAYDVPPDDDLGDFDSSSPGGTQGFGVIRAMMLGLLTVMVAASIGVVAWRARLDQTHRFTG